MKITGRFGQEGDGRPIEEGFFDGHGAPADGTAAFFPIIQMREPGPWEPIGTGFFISNNGLFATAKHVVLDEQGRLIEGLAGVQLLRSDKRVIVRQAKKIAVHARADVAIGFLFDREFAAGRGQTVNKCFALSRDLPAVGSKVATIAFPKSQLTEDQGAFSLKFAASAVSGTIEEYHPGGRDSVMLPGRCFRTSMDIAAGASGGPVAFGDGWVFGINSTGMEGAPIGFVSSVEDILDLDAGRVRLPSGEIREQATIRDLTELGLVILR
jgi:S1-C subfamily serine protease